MVDHYWHIRNCSLFKKLDNSQLARLEQGARARSFPRGSAVYLPTDPVDGAYLLAAGRIRISSTTPDGKMAIHGFIEPGELFGELGLIDSGCREQRADAVLAATVILFAGNSLQALMEQSAQLSLQVTKLIGLRLKRMERRLNSLLFRSNRERLGLLLVDLLEHYGKPSDGGMLIDIKLSHQDLAGLIGATRESITHLMGTMQLEGILKFGRQRIVVRERQRLLAGDRVERSLRLDLGAVKPIDVVRTLPSGFPQKPNATIPTSTQTVKCVTDSASQNSDKC